MIWLRWIIAAICAVALALFAVANRDVVMLRLDPFPYDIEVPLYLALITTLVIGLFAGAIAAWLAGGRDRRALRAARREITRLSREMTDGLPDKPQQTALPPPTP